MNSALLPGTYAGVSSTSNLVARTASERARPMSFQDAAWLKQEGQRWLRRGAEVPRGWTCRGFTETNDRWFPKDGCRLVWKGGIPCIKHCQGLCPGSYGGHLTPWVTEFRKERRPPRPLYRAPSLGDVTVLGRMSGTQEESRGNGEGRAEMLATPAPAGSWPGCL